MIERYSLPKMRAIWQDENKFKKMLKIEMLACEAMAKMGIIPTAELKNIKEAKFNLEKIKEKEKKTGHDVVAFIEDISEGLGRSARFLHLGLTSNDILDTALAVLMKEAAGLLLDDLKKLSSALAKKARQHKDTPMVARTHGVHAEPTTFGLKLALFFDETERNEKRLEDAMDIISVGKISGAVGTFANVDPQIERYVCQRLGLKPANVATQVLQRDRHAQYLCALAIIGATLEKIATEIRNLQRTEILEAQEYFSKTQKGSSAMPHKRNPVRCERICGLARILRANAQVALENIALWHERDISHSSAERLIIPDSCILLDFMLNEMADLIQTLVVLPDNMKKNLEKTKGLMFSQRIMIELIKKGLSRKTAYELVQKNSMKAWDENKSLLDLLIADKEVLKHLSKEQIKKCFDVRYYLRHVDTIFKRVGL